MHWLLRFCTFCLTRVGSLGFDASLGCFAVCCLGYVFVGGRV